MATEEEPVGYLGGDVNPYADSYAEEEEDVAGYLEGAEAAGDDLPALPGDGGGSPYQTDEYSAKDFMDPSAEEGYDPYADGYGYDEAGYQTQGAEEDAAYFDSMGAGAQTAPAPESYVDDYADDYDDDPDQPKTISQQDAESIIRRITTKRIMPPEQEARPKLQPALTPARGGMKMWPFVLVLLLGGAGGGAYVYKAEVGKYLHDMGFPETAKAWFGYEPPPPPVIVDETPRKTPEQLAQEEMERMLRLSEAKAFSLDPSELGGEEAAADEPGESGN